MHKNHFTTYIKKTFLLITIITTIGIVLRLSNLSPFKLYPDSYQSLIVAKNIEDYQSVLGYLGPNGMLYPNFFAWSRPGYPFAIDLIKNITHDATTSAKLLALITGIVSIPFVFFFLKKVFSSTKYGLAGALLLAVSFNHTVWSGFIMTETTGIFFMIIFLLSIFTNIHTKPSFSNWGDMLSGILFAFACMTRYEYFVIILPVIMLIFFNCKQRLIKIITILTTFFLMTGIIIQQLFPIPSTFTVIASQLQDMLFKGVMLLIIVFSFTIIFMLIPKQMKPFIKKYISFLVIIIIWLATPFFFQTFLLHDFLICIFSLIGFSLMLIKDNTRANAYFALTCGMMLFIIYHHINPEMERYITHLIPFLLIPASYGLINSIEKTKELRVKGIPIIIIISFLTLLQTFITYRGMKYSQDPSWYRVSYEDKVSERIKNYIHSDNVLLIASYPEPYYFALHIPTQSIADSPPYIYIDNVPDNQKILIIEDMGMHDDFPKFTRFINKNLKSNKIKSFWIHENFHHIAEVQDEKYPIEIYEIMLSDLKKKIQKAY